MSRRVRIRALPLALAGAIALVAPAAAERLDPSAPFMRGMVVSCPRGGDIWGTPTMAEALAELESLGVEWVAIHPYARIGRDGEVRWRPVERSGYLARANDMVRAAGLRFFWKPHLGYWGSFEWRGAIEFGDEPSWSLFFSGYRDFILEQARFAESIGAEIFAIGVELELTTHRPEWRAIIREVRRVYSGRLTYAANWDRLDRVPFWSELDLIGVHAYFPLSEEASPSLERLERGWTEALAGLRALSATHGGMPVVFAEIGYDRALSAAAQPWVPRMDDSPAAVALRRGLIELALDRLEHEPPVAGMFWWKWIPGPNDQDRDFSMKDEEAKEALRRFWARRPPEAAGDPALATPREP
jgi:hypothetical protein